MLGPGVVSLARVFLAGLDVRAVARPHMQALAESAAARSTSRCATAGDGADRSLPAALVDARAALDVGSRAPMANSALGRAYLGAVEPAERTR
jgi:DNA-binding IclR family transcriptional regulator